MTIHELSDYLHVHRSTLYRLLKQRELPGAFKIGSDWRFNRDEIDRWRLGLNHAIAQPSR
jgi:excisionase family DNA binding protein